MGYNFAEQHRKVSEYIYHLGEADGIEKGFQKGRQEGRLEGAVMGAIKVMLSMKVPTDVICQKMNELYSLNEEQVMAYISGKQQ